MDNSNFELKKDTLFPLSKLGKFGLSLEDIEHRKQSSFEYTSCYFIEKKYVLKQQIPSFDMHPCLVPFCIGGIMLEISLHRNSLWQQPLITDRGKTQKARSIK
jgi:hypothetical protein